MDFLKINRGSWIYKNYVAEIGYEANNYKCNVFWIALRHWAFESGYLTEYRLIRPATMLLLAVLAVVLYLRSVAMPQLTARLLLFFCVMVVNTVIATYVYAKQNLRGGYFLYRLSLLALGPLITLPGLIIVRFFILLGNLLKALFKNDAVEKITDKTNEVARDLDRNLAPWLGEPLIDSVFPDHLTRFTLVLAVLLAIPVLFWTKLMLIVYASIVLFFLTVLVVVYALFYGFRAIVFVVALLYNGIATVIKPILPKKKKVQRQYIEPEEPEGDSFFKIARVSIAAWYHKNLCPPVKFVGRKTRKRKAYL